MSKGRVSHATWGGTAFQAVFSRGQEMRVQKHSLKGCATLERKENVGLGGVIMG